MDLEFSWVELWAEALKGAGVTEEQALAAISGALVAAAGYLASRLLGWAARGSGRVAWLSARAAACLFVRRPGETGRLVLEALEGARYDATSPDLAQLLGTGCVAQRVVRRGGLGEPLGEAVAAYVQGREVALDAPTRKKIGRLFDAAERAAREAKERAAEDEAEALGESQRRAIRLALLGGDRPEVPAPPPFVPNVLGSKVTAVGYGPPVLLPVADGRRAWFRKRLDGDGRVSYEPCDPPDALPHEVA